MTVEIFRDVGSELAFSDAEELERVISEIDSSVPGRTEGRRSHHRERYCITRYLGALASASLLDFPLVVTKGESPDFFLRPNDGRTVGLEITDAGTEAHQRAATEFERSPAGTLLEGEASLRRLGEPLQGRPYIGDEAERELSQLVLNALNEKTITLNRPHFAQADSYELLIYDNSHLVPLADLEDAAPLLRASLTEWLNEQQSERAFALVSVMRDSKLLYDCTKRSTLLQVPQYGKKREKDV